MVGYETALDDKALFVLEKSLVKTSWSYLSKKLSILKGIAEERDGNRSKKAIESYIEITDSLFKSGFLSLAFELGEAYQLKGKIIFRTRQSQNGLSSNESREFMDAAVESTKYLRFAKTSGDQRAFQYCQKLENDLKVSGLNIRCMEENGIMEIQFYYPDSQPQEESSSYETRTPKALPDTVKPPARLPRAKDLEKQRDEELQKEIEQQRTQDRMAQKSLEELSSKFMPTIQYEPFAAKLAPLEFSNPKATFKSEVQHGFVFLTTPLEASSSQDFFLACCCS